MEEKDRPITDKDNFPGAEKTATSRVMVDMASLAYVDGLSDGYRKAVTDFLLWSLAFMVVAILARSVAVPE